MKKKNDMNVGQGISTERANWNFSGKVAETFDEHVQMSVPLYNEGHGLVCNISDFFCHNDSTCYELGVSTGALIKKLATYNNNKPDIKWIGIDREQPMIDKAKENCKDISNIELIEGAMAGGAAGISIGRNAFQHRTPARFVRAASCIVHENKSVDEALELLKM